ncbi:MAG TPA: response regulator [Terriglobia bacterium]|nr:response regulator [Terriglobia bacterium]
MRVVIAEDDPVSRLLLVATVRKWGHEPVVACDGLEALALFQHGDPPELAFLDWMMPELDGPEVCRRIRESHSTTPIYIIILTAKTQREDLVAGLASGANDFVTKPFNHEELHARFQVGMRVVDLQKKLADRVRELDVAMSQLRLLQQAQKLEALGQMSSGIAHEINTPAQYIGENIRFIQESWSQVQPFLERESNNSDIDYLIKEVPKAIAESLQGIQKVSRIVRAMRDFSHPTGESKLPVDINRAIETTISVATSHWRYVADMETSLDDTIPTALCYSGEIHQVLFNLIANAADAISLVSNNGERRGTIYIATSAANGCIEIRIRDTGSGIPEEHRGRIFEPFFTTKVVGQGTGQGLSTAYSIIVQQHSGEILFDTETGKGTTFVVRIPIGDPGERSHEREEANSVR